MLGKEPMFAIRIIWGALIIISWFHTMDGRVDGAISLAMQGFGLETLLTTTPHNVVIDFSSLMPPILKVEFDTQSPTYSPYHSMRKTLSNMKSSTPPGMQHIRWESSNPPLS